MWLENASCDPDKSLLTAPENMFLLTVAQHCSGCNASHTHPKRSSQHTLQPPPAAPPCYCLSFKITVFWKEGDFLSFLCVFSLFMGSLQNWSWVKTTVKEQKTPKKGKAGCEVYLTEALGSVHLPTRFVSPSRQEQEDS